MGQGRYSNNHIFIFFHISNLTWSYTDKSSKIFLCIKIYGPREAKKCLRACAKCKDSNHPAHAQSMFRAYALHLYIL